MELKVQEFKAQEVAPVQIPPLASQSVLVAGYDPRDGSLRVLNLGALVEPLILAEKAYCLDRLDERNMVEATIKAGSAVGAKATKELVVPAGEVWYLNRIRLLSPAESGADVGDIVKVNVAISIWPKSEDGSDKTYWAEGKGTAAEDTFDIDLPAQGELGEELRLVEGDKLTLIAELTGANAGADLTASMVPFGRKGRRLI